MNEGVLSESLIESNPFTLFGRKFERAILSNNEDFVIV